MLEPTDSEEDFRLISQQPRSHFRSIPTFVVIVSQRYRQTEKDGQTTCRGITALCVAQRGKKCGSWHASVTVLATSKVKLTF